MYCSKSAKWHHGEITLVRNYFENDPFLSSSTRERIVDEGKLCNIQVCLDESKIDGATSCGEDLFLAGDLFILRRNGRECDR